MHLSDVRTKPNILEWACLFYFSTALVISQVDNTTVKLLYYLSILFCFAAAAFAKCRVPLKVIVLILATGACGLLNYLAVGNMTVLRWIIIMSGFIVATVFIDERVPSRVFLCAFVLNAAVVIFHMIRDGYEAPVYISVSNNYISVYLLAVLVLYYLKEEERAHRVPLGPAVAFWILCFFGGSRMGIIMSSFFLCGLAINNYVLTSDNLHKRLLLLIAFGVIIIAVGVMIAPQVAYNLSEYRVIARLHEEGLKSAGRARIWSEYISLLKKPFNLMLGVPLGQVYWAAKYYDGNLHNSYLLVHAMFGIVGFAGLVGLLINSICKAVRNRRWVFVIALLAFCMRAFTDHVFGCTRMSPVLLSFLIYPFFMIKETPIEIDDDLEQASNDD